MVVRFNESGGKQWVNENGTSSYKSIDNTAAPGVLVHSTASGKKAAVYCIVMTNNDASDATITFYDENSNVKLVYYVDAKTTKTMLLDYPIVWNNVDIYARTDQSTVSDVTVQLIEVI